MLDRFDRNRQIEGPAHGDRRAHEPLRDRIVEHVPGEARIDLQEVEVDVAQPLE